MVAVFKILLCIFKPQTKYLQLTLGYELFFRESNNTQSEYVNVRRHPNYFQPEQHVFLVGWCYALKRKVP